MAMVIMDDSVSPQIDPNGEGWPPVRARAASAL